MQYVLKIGLNINFYNSRITKIKFGINTTYVSINHTDKILNKYFKILDNIFLKIKKCEISVLEIDDLLSLKYVIPI